MANVERSAAITKEIRSTCRIVNMRQQRRAHACMRGCRCVCVCVCLRLCVCLCMYVRACLRACGVLVRLATWDGDGRPSALMHEARKSHFVGQPSGAAALEI
jgi:hypothetical protein